MDHKRQFDRFYYAIKLNILVVEFFVIEKSGNSWKNTIEYFYNGLISSIISNSINSRLIQLVGIDNLELIKKKALVYQKEKSWINT